MTREENIREILECNFSGTKEELIDIAVKNIMALSQEPINETVQKAYEDGKKDGYVQAKAEQEPCDDAISRDAVIEWLENATYEDISYAVGTELSFLPSVTQKSGKWIPVSERLPDNTDPVNITWVNHDPESYYVNIKDKPFTATGHYCNGKWWWYSVACQDYLDEYGHSDVDAMDEAIEVTAWMPLPNPYEPQERSDKE